MPSCEWDDRKAQAKMAARGTDHEAIGTGKCYICPGCAWRIGHEEWTAFSSYGVLFWGRLEKGEEHTCSAVKSVFEGS